MGQFIRFTLPLFLCLNFLSCSHTSDNLNTAEQLMATTPDSALHILQKLKHNLFTSRSDKALYALLMSQALDKNDIKVESDSLISVATKYYDDKEPIYAGYAWFYRARCAYNRGDAKTQADALLKAQEFAEKAADDRLMGLVCGDKGSMYKAQGSTDSSICYFKQSFRSFTKSKDNRNSIIILLNIGAEFLKISRLDSAEYYFFYAKKIAKHTNDMLLYSTIYRSLGSVYLKQNNYNRAIYFYKKVPKTTIELYNSNKWFLLANAYIRIGKTDSTRYCLNKVKDLYEMTADYYQLWGTLYEKEGNIHKALYYSKLATVTLDSTYKRKLDVSFAGLEKKYKYQGLQLSNQQLIIQNKQNRILLLIVLIMLSMGIIAFLLWRNIVRNHELQVKQQLLEKEINLVEKEKENINLLEKQIRIQNVLLSNVDQYRKNSIKRPHSSNVKQVGISPVLNQTFHEELIASMDIQYHDISKRLIERFPDLTERDILICCLLLAEFESGMIASILDVKIESINKHRHRLRTKLKLQNSDNLVEYLRNF